MAATHEGNRAEGACVVASFGDLEVAHVRLVSEVLPDSGVRRYRVPKQPSLRELRHQRVQVMEAQEHVDLGHLLPQVFLVPLDEAPHCNHGLDRSVLLELGRAQDRLDRLLLGRVDEPARVDDHHVGVLDVRHDRRAVPHELTHQALGIHGGLVTAEGNDAESHRDRIYMWSGQWCGVCRIRQDETPTATCAAGVIPGCPVYRLLRAVHDKKLSRARARLTWRSRASAFSLIWRTRSRVIPIIPPISSSVIAS